MKKVFVFHVFFFIILYNIVAQNIVLNEVVYTNRTIIADEDGNTPDWIEIYNNSQQTINLENFGLSDRKTNPLKWQFPSLSINPGEFIVVFASGKNKLDTQTLHTNFKISVLKENIYLSTPNGEIIDSILTECVPADKSLGKFPDGSSTVEVLSNPSFGSSNNHSEILNIDFQRDTLTFSHKNGIYKAPFELELKAGNPNNEIYFTIDAEDPDDESNSYQNALNIYNRSVEENKYSNIRTSHQKVKPKEKVFKSNVIRAVVYNNGCPASNIHTKNYFVSENFHKKFPVNVIAITTDPDNFFDKDEGIYIYGNKVNYFNKGKEWEKEAHIELFDTKGNLLLEQGMGVRIHGRNSRLSPQKSLRLYADEEYGAGFFEHPLFPNKSLDSYKRLILRTTQGDWTQTLFKDEFCHYIARNLDIDYMSHMPTVVFIDGEYWGIHNLRERQDEYYIKSNHNINVDSFDVIEYAKFDGIITESGDFEKYDELIDYIINNDLTSSSSYDSLNTMIDLNSTIDYFITQMYLGNKDFPDLNVALWRPKTADGRFRYFFFDCDGCMTQANYNLFPEFIHGIEDLKLYPEWSRVIFRGLLQNHEFRKKFHARFLNLLQDDFSAGTVLATLDEFEKIYEPLIGEHIVRWQKPTDYQKWKDNVDKLRKFVIQRPAEMFQQLDELFKNPFIVSPNPSKGAFSIKFFDKIDDNVTVNIYNINGKKVYTNDYSLLSSLNINLNMNLICGTYLLVVETEEFIFSEKLIIA